MKYLVIGMVVSFILAIVSCGSPVSNLCHKLERCELLEDSGYDDVEECIDEGEESLEESYDEIDRHCEKAQQVKNASDKLLSCYSKMSCEELEDYDHFKVCGEEWDEYMEKFNSNCDYGDDDDDDIADDDDYYDDNGTTDDDDDYYAGDDDDDDDDSCNYGEFECHDGRCIPDDYVCDGYEDCSDGEDEKYC